MDKATIENRISYLKNDIQYLIDKKKDMDKENDKDKLKQIDEKKKVKLSELKVLVQNLKEIVIEERREKQNVRELNALHRTIDNLNYWTAKKKKTEQDVVKTAKEKRDKAREEYNKYLQLESKYLEKDPKQIPGILFLHNSVVEKYGVCPYIKIELQEETDTEITTRVEEERKQWLESQNDQGKMYYDLYESIIERKQINALVEEKEKLEVLIEQFIKDYLEESQLDIYKDSVKLINEYISCQIKTKKIKERYKTFIHNLSILKAETGLDIATYLSIKHKHEIMINDIPCTSISKHSIQTQMLFETQLESYKTCIDSMDQKEKYVSNTLRNLKNELYLFLTNQGVDKSSNKQVRQVGKYFKRWSLLSEDEKRERFTSYVDYFIQKNVVQQNILEDQNLPVLSDNLVNLLCSSYKEKTLIYRDMKWNTKGGMIENINGIKYDEDKKEFYLTFKAKRQKHREPKAKRKSSIKTVITNQNEKDINEEVLHYIVKKLQMEPETEIISSKEDKERCLERIKLKLKVKKISADDKTYVYKKYDEIFEVVKSNKVPKV